MLNYGRFHTICDDRAAGSAFFGSWARIGLRSPAPAAICRRRWISCRGGLGFENLQCVRGSRVRSALNPSAVLGPQALEPGVLGDPFSVPRVRLEQLCRELQPRTSLTAASSAASLYRHPWYPGKIPCRVSGHSGASRCLPAYVSGNERRLRFALDVARRRTHSQALAEKAAKAIRKSNDGGWWLTWMTRGHDFGMLRALTGTQSRLYAVLPALNPCLKTRSILELG